MAVNDGARGQGRGSTAFLTSGFVPPETVKTKLGYDAGRGTV